MLFRVQASIEQSTYEELVKYKEKYDKETISQMVRFIIKDWLKAQKEIE